MIVLLGALGIPWREPPRRQAAAHRQDHVALVQVRDGMLAAHAHEQRVVLRKRALGLQRRDHRRVQQLRQRHQLRRRPRVDDPLAGVDQRVGRPHQQVDGLHHVRRVRRRLVPAHRIIRVHRLVIDAGRVGHRQHHRTGTPAAQHRERPPQELRRPLGTVDVAEPLGNGLEAGGDVELRVLAAAGRHAVGDAQHGRVVLERLRQPGIRILQPRAVHAALHRAHADAVAARDPRVGVGQGHGVAVVPHHDHGHALAPQGVVHPADGKGRNPLHALRLQNPRNGSGNINTHTQKPRCLGLGIRWRLYHSKASTQRNDEWLDSTAPGMSFATMIGYRADSAPNEFNWLTAFRTCPDGQLSKESVKPAHTPQLSNRCNR